MDTLRTQLPNENQEMKRLFQQLFRFQILLNDNVDSDFYEDSDVKNTIVLIDHLMGLLMKMYDIEENE